jgi:F-type H+-transporting ATPase subunit a
MTMAAQGPNASEYIVHHLTHLKSATQTALVDWSVFHLDTLFWSITLGLLTEQGHVRRPGPLPGRRRDPRRNGADQAKGIVHAPSRASSLLRWR